MLNLTHNSTIHVLINETDETKKTVGQTFFEVTQIITGLYLYPLFSLFGIFGNLMNFIIYRNSKKYSTNIYLIALALSDILKLVNDMLYFVVNFISIIDKTTSSIIFHKIYTSSHYIFVLSAINTSWLTCAIAFDRYVSICKHIKKKPFNNTQSFMFVIAILFISAVLAIPSPLFLKSIEMNDPLKNKTVYNLVETPLGKSKFMIAYRYLSGIIRVVIPLIILLFLNYQIISFVYKAKHRKAWLNVKPKTRSTQMLITIVITFIFCIFPDAIMTMMQFGYASESSYVIRGLREITDFLLLVNSASTFPICFYFSIEYRMKFNKFFSKFEIKRLCSQDQTNKAENNVCEVKRYSIEKNRNKNNNKGATIPLVSLQL